jgi:dipeptidyl-peptidase-4
MQKSSITAMLILIAYSAIAQKKPLTNDQFFKNNFKGIVNSTPIGGVWINGSSYLYTGKNGKLVLDAKSGTDRNATETDVVKPVASNLPFIKGNDVYYNVDGQSKQLTKDEATEENPTLSPDGKYIAYTKKNNLYTVSVADGKETQLTHDGTDVVLNGYSSWVYMEEILGRASQYKAFWWNPNSKNIAFFRFDETKVPEFTMTDAPGQHGQVSSLRYPKVGDPNPEVKVGIVAPNGGSIVWADFNEKEDQYFGLPYWKPDGSTLLVQWMNRLQNELKIWAVAPENGSKKSFLTETQKTWINLDDEGDRIHFLNNGKGFLYLSDQSGYQHVYFYDMEGKLKADLTASPKTNVTEINHVDEKNNILYFTARKENTARKDLYSVKLDGKKMQRLTFGEYNHVNFQFSPTFEYFTTIYGNAYTPNSLAVLSTKGKLIKVLSEGKGPQFDSLELAETKMVRVMSDDSIYALPMKITWPMNMVKGKKYPVLISIYGGPNAGTVMDNWTLTGSQQWYAKEGLIQVAMDHRASGHFGKEGVNYMYHNLGYWEMKDYSTMVKWLIDSAQADPSKICITGFSYGGYLSSYALTYGADVFTHGMAGGSVIDWSLYDSHYTERFMGTKENNPEGYKTSSVLSHTKNYKGMLQIVHGVVDENVHMQNSIQLISQLQDQKKDFDFMAYSGGRHGWGGNKGLHFQNLKTKFIYKHLLEKEVPKEMLK